MQLGALERCLPDVYDIIPTVADLSLLTGPSKKRLRKRCVMHTVWQDFYHTHTTNKEKS